MRINGPALLALRESSGLTQAALGEMAGVSQARLSELEASSGTPVRATTAKALADTLRVPLPAIILPVTS